ncbi:MAG: 30S ribosomal protein S2 [Candidatus Marinimicrobia bacterium]|jgi:small subunit ribosomal protein S2|nr:30S ribosomal protein S2 [Candidatus Neomarinimicrobiota bacterium]MBT3936194.1 30S ribosomal protein S2 [Candidatus Neomarinimicrobiota bacterium]MBT3960646.1 30S ribosomal protein S2 [Candidatus Neomarinimicrobiota bacterium]MBT4384095.1 30S ribosomal protein S2 [Candidatus Neomarinimicrobiota bacterium]MBT4635337.1 30S ribosomal protein S2 [Candidatus Neomarinimicrobiota bacterium]
MAELKFEDLLGTGAHFGHVTRKWNPKFAPYILMEKNGVHIIDLEQTLKAIDTASKFLNKVVNKNGEVLFVGTKKQARDIVQQEADRCGMFYIVERWLGGTLTNFSTIKKSIKRLKMLEKEGSNLYDNLTKKETQMLNRERVKLSDQHRGIKDMRRLPEAVILVDAQYEEIAIQEATRLEIPVIAIVDSNTDPTKVAYPIPANDDSIRSIQLILSSMADAIIDAKGGVPEEKLSDAESKVEETVEETVEVAPVEEVKAEKTEEKVEEPKEEVVEEAVVETPEVTEEVSDNVDEEVEASEEEE